MGTDSLTEGNKGNEDKLEFDGSATFIEALDYGFQLLERE